MRTWRSLAGALNISEQLLCMHRKNHPDHPAVDDLEGWEAFMAQYGRSGNAPASVKEQLAKQRLGLLTDTREKMRIEIERARGGLIERAEVERRIYAGVNRLFHVVESWVLNEQPQELVGLDARQIAAANKKRFERIKEEARATFERRESLVQPENDDNGITTTEPAALRPDDQQPVIDGQGT